MQMIAKSVVPLTYTMLLAASNAQHYDYLGGTEYAMFDGSHSFECGRQRKDD